MLILLGLYFMKRATKPKLSYFKESEFRGWYPFINSDLLEALDELRRLWGSPIGISAAAGAIGRKDNSSSQHNFLKWGEVRAVDVMPTIYGRGLNTNELAEFYRIARNMNAFSGIGVYPDWKPRAGLHLDVREDRTATAPALWGGIQENGRQKYVGINQVLGVV